MVSKPYEWEESMRAMIEKLVFKGNITGTMYVAEYDHNHAIHKMDHLACFVGRVRTPGWQIVYMNHTGRHQLNVF